MAKIHGILINRNNTLSLLLTLTLTLTFNTKKRLGLKYLSFQRSIKILGIRTYEKRAEMDVTLVEAECKKQYEGQICKKENGSTLYPKAKTTRPHKRNNSCHCTPIGHTKEP